MIISRTQWEQAFANLGWQGPVPAQLWASMNAADSIVLDWPDLYRMIKQIGWSDQHAQVLWQELSKLQAPTAPAPNTFGTIPPDPVHNLPGGGMQPPPDPAAAWGGNIYANKPPAGWWARAAAVFLDGLILMVPIFIAQLVIGGLIGSSLMGSVSSSPLDIGALFVAILVPVLLAMVIPILYTWMTMRRQGSAHGKTIGKGIAGVKVVQRNGNPVSDKHILMREVLGKIILFDAGLIFFSIVLAKIDPTLSMICSLLYVLGWYIACPLADSENRCPHDLIAGTKPIKG